MSPALNSREFAALGGKVGISVADPASDELLSGAQEIVGRVHSDLSRFDPDSELSRLNEDPRTEIEISPLMSRFLLDVIGAARISGGLVDATCLDSLERAGYRASMDFARESDAIKLYPSSELPRHPAAPHGEARWAEVEVDPDRGVVRRAPGIRFDSGGLGKGLAADLVAEFLDEAAYFSVDCGGDLRVGGLTAGDVTISVANPLRGQDPLAELSVPAGHAVATSGITRSAWIGPEGEYSHHLIDPGTGLPAFTGIVQVSAVAPTAVEAEVRAKAALLVGPASAAEWLEYGGLIILEGGELRRIASADSAATTAG
ncbi:MAG TPA: FAD:protein FMN transferase [Solirubrobacterales bacterium]|nr:FAD:protein FMN transferase [Solirubrobacterales bacterium]